MIDYEIIERVVNTKDVKAITCDICGKSYKAESEDWREECSVSNFVSIRKEFSYPSYLDGEEVSIDICEECFIEKFGTDFINKHIV